MFNRSAVPGVDLDLRTINFLFKNTSFREVYRNVQDAIANYEIHMALVPAVADLFSNMKTWRTYPLTVNQIRVERIGLLRWLLLSFSGKAAWTAFTAAVSRVMIYPAQQVAKGYSTSSPHDTQVLDRELQYLSKILRRNILYQRMGGPLLENEPESNRAEVDWKARGFSNFAWNNVWDNEITLERLLEDAEVALRDLQATQQVAIPEPPRTGVDQVCQQRQGLSNQQIHGSTATEIETSASRAVRATSRTDVDPSRRELSPVSPTEDTAPTQRDTYVTISPATVTNQTMLEEIAKLCENMQKANDLLEKLATESEERGATENGAASSDNKLENEQNIKSNASGLGQSKPLNKDSSVITTGLVPPKSCEVQRDIQNGNPLAAPSEFECSMNRAEIKPDSKSEMRQEGRGENKQEKQQETKKQTMIEIQQQTKPIKNEEIKSINVELKMPYASDSKNHSIATASQKNRLTTERSHSPELVVQSASILSSSCGSLPGSAFDESDSDSLEEFVDLEGSRHEEDDDFDIVTSKDLDGI